MSALGHTLLCMSIAAVPFLPACTDSSSAEVGREVETKPAPSLYERIAAKLEADPDLAARLDAPAAELESARWLVGTWDVTATVFATSSTPERRDAGVSVVSPAMGGTWLEITGTYPTGTQDLGFLGFDPVARQWVSLALDSAGDVVVNRASGWEGDRLTFTGSVHILGEDVTLRQTLARHSDTEYVVLNEELLADGRWQGLDSYLYRKRTSESDAH
jgi:hypothetical protein